MPALSRYGCSRSDEIRDPLFRGRHAPPKSAGIDHDRGSFILVPMLSGIVGNLTFHGRARFLARVVCLGAIGVAPALHASQIALTYIGPSPQHFIVPANVFSLQVKLWGAGGASAGGSGGYVTALLDVTPNEDLVVIVAGGGNVSQGLAVTPGGFGGGGDGSGYFDVFTSTPYNGGSGGGGTSIMMGNTVLLDAAGGGGGVYSEVGGSAGGMVGQNGIGFDPGGGGTQTAGGSNPVTLLCHYVCDGSFGTGGNADIFQGGGGGGGGYYGGGGGGFSTPQANAPGAQTGGGGGGSSYIGGPGVSNAITLSGSSANFSKGSLPAGIADLDYQSGIGTGGAYSVSGGNGLAVLSWTTTQAPEPSTGLVLCTSLIWLAGIRKFLRPRS